ncbi:potassium channel family protein [Clostridium cellulovorans]|uniref:TrkA-N domain protein n=1 Tax=Clostridium cellulovorans (strain ATCC 35296 / DSM 3052 / OCM 3 / 743B) TaxID=573061 RepID=D9SM22_CLOC7|nr:TrkA family potassium uptake protein [Clostridium cellulovorans]ADL51753.1 TrkA-N domain protein [Clostridium cellulovorans 743B]
MGKKQFVVVGLGIFGFSVATNLYELGHEVLAIDKDEEIVHLIQDQVTQSVICDTQDEENLKALGVRNFDVAVVAIGSNIQSSIMTTLLLKEMGVKYIVAKANDDTHARVLKKIGADKVISPEKDMGKRVAHNLISSNVLDYVELSADYSIVEIAARKSWIGKTLAQLNLRAQYGINVMAIKKGTDLNITPSPNEVIEAEDIFVAIGSNEVTEVDFLKE